MANREQVAMLNETCPGGFLPPFAMKDGGVWNNVEFWSGGFQLFNSKHCRMQRIVAMEPGKFSQHLLYHSSNNKQFTISQERMCEIHGMHQELMTFWSNHK